MKNQSLSKRGSLEDAATKLLNDLSKFEQLKELGNRKNYPHKLNKLEEKLKDEIDLWERKKPSAKLEDLKKDLTFVLSQKEVPFFNKERIDLLTDKYSTGYGKSDTNPD